MSILRNKAKKSRSHGAPGKDHVIRDSRPAAPHVEGRNSHLWVSGERVKALAFYQLSVADIAAVLGCGAELISSQFADEYEEGVEAGKDAILNALTRNAVIHQNLPAQLFLHHARIRSAALATAEAKKAEEMRFYAMTSQEREQQVVEAIERLGIDKMYPEEMAQIRAEHGLPQPNGKPKAD